MLDARARPSRWSCQRWVVVSTQLVMPGGRRVTAAAKPSGRRGRPPVERGRMSGTSEIRGPRARQASMAARWMASVMAETDAQARAVWRSGARRRCRGSLERAMLWNGMPGCIGSFFSAPGSGVRGLARLRRHGSLVDAWQAHGRSLASAPQRLVVQAPPFMRPDGYQRGMGNSLRARSWCGPRASYPVAAECGVVASHLAAASQSGSARSCCLRRSSGGCVVSSRTIVWRWHARIPS